MFLAICDSHVMLVHLVYNGFNILLIFQLLQSFAKVKTTRAGVDHAMIQEDLEELEDFIAALESRLLFLTADARSTLR